MHVRHEETYSTRHESSQGMRHIRHKSTKNTSHVKHGSMQGARRQARWARGHVAHVIQQTFSCVIYRMLFSISVSTETLNCSLNHQLVHCERRLRYCFFSFVFLTFTIQIITLCNIQKSSRDLLYKMTWKIHFWASFCLIRHRFYRIVIVYPFLAFFLFNQALFLQNCHCIPFWSLLSNEILYRIVKRISTQGQRPVLVTLQYDMTNSTVQVKRLQVFHFL